MQLKTCFATYNRCYLAVDTYCYDGSTAISLWNRKDGPIARLTVCCSDKKIKPGHSYIDVNNCPEALGLIKKYKLGKETGRVKFAGYCCYPEVEWNMEEVMKHVK